MALPPRDPRPDGHHPASCLALRLAAVLLLAIAPLNPAPAAPLDDPPAVPALREQFETLIRPILAERCWGCHGPEKQKSELRLDSRAALLAGGLAGPAVVPGKPEESLLIEAIQHGDALKMPPGAKLPDAEIQALTRWVGQGAHWPESPVARSSPDPRSTARIPAAISPQEFAARAQRWAFQPLPTHIPVPAVNNLAWSANPIDRFLLARLETAGLAPAHPADRATLIRRLSFDLLGLPPTPEQVEAFQNDPRPDAYPRLVDRLLASPHYGERWGRHWLDLVRYAESYGHEFDYDIPNAWRYRDYVIRAWNADLPFDQFAREQIAGDLLQPPRRDPHSGANESVQATAFWLLGEGTHSPVDVREEQLRRIDNQIDVLGKTFLGLTLACARCHDHKFDPLTQKDYYALAGFLKSSRHRQAPIEDGSPADLKRWEPIRRLAREIALNLTPPPELASQPPSIPPAPPANFAESFHPEHTPWSTSGPAFARVTPSPALRIARKDGQPALAWIPAGTFHSGLLADRAWGTARSFTWTIRQPFLHIRAWGDRAQIHIVIDGFDKIRDPIYGALTRQVDSSDQPAWFSFDLSAWSGHRAYIELADGAAVDFTSAQSRVLDGDGYLAVTQVLTSDSHQPPPADSRQPVPIPLGTIPAELRSQIEAYLNLTDSLPPPQLIPALADGPGEQEFLLRRGNAKLPADPVPRRAPEILSPQSLPQDPTRGSGRLQLARHLVGPQAPLPARVIANRLWLHHFGAGLVPTPDDFGHMGEPPSHPELLDWLAAQLHESGWSLKSLHRLILTSSAYRMASRHPAETLANRVDPANRLLHRQNLRRLEAEPIRDAILALSGRLDPAIGGPPVPVHLTPFMDGRGRPAHSGPPDGLGKRSIYLAVRRNFLPPFFLAFDFPPPASTMGKRNASNVPAQALVLQNDPLVLDLARAWAQRLLAQQPPPPDTSTLIRGMYLAAFSRSPSESELLAARDFLGPMSALPDLERCAALAHALLCAKEFRFIP